MYQNLKNEKGVNYYKTTTRQKLYHHKASQLALRQPKKSIKLKITRSL